MIQMSSFLKNKEGDITLCIIVFKNWKEVSLIFEGSSRPGRDVVQAKKVKGRDSFADTF